MKRSARLPFLAAAIAPLLWLTPTMAQTGPMIGAVGTHEARFLYRPLGTVDTLRLSVLDGLTVVATDETTTDPENDYVAKFHVTGLSPDTVYDYKIEGVTVLGDVSILGPEDGLRFRTAKPKGKRGVITAAFASCAKDSAEPTWQRMELLGVDRVFFGGDTPYIDSGDLATVRFKHRSFLESPFLSQLIRKTPTVGTWDDHDFGVNDGNGLFAAKNQTRRAFVEYRAHDQFGTGTEGVYHKTDLGDMEVFLLDPRWWSQTGPSPVDPTQTTCFGPEQWQWIRDSLLASRAPFKVLMMGQIWQDKKNPEIDDMFTYWYERDALFDFIRQHEIPGVVLVGGDIHVSQYYVHRQRVGYDLHDFVTSPAYNGPLPGLNKYHPDKEWSSELGRQFLTLSADTRSNPHKLTGRFYLADGTVQKEIVIPYDELTPKHGGGLGRSLRAWWDFDGDFTNKSTLGSRLDASPVGGVGLVENAGLRGGGVQLSRPDSGYLVVPRSPLDDNSAGHTVSLWCRPQTLPAHESSERAFLVESTATGEASSSSAWVISIGLRASSLPGNINLQLNTRTIQPAVAAESAPTTLSQGPFDCTLDRSLFSSRWVHVVMTFDSHRIKLYIDGTEVADHALPVPGPAAEFGGLIIGGHREGVGRNFDGMMDEIALWQRVLDPAEIVELHNTGSPEALPTALSETDGDGDTLPDWYENLHGLDPGDSDDAVSDLDDDGVPAYLERQAGTDPSANDSDFFSFLRGYADPFCAGEGIFSYRHPSLNTLKFRIGGDSSGDLDSWQPLDELPEVDASIQSESLRIEDTRDPETRRFYRMQAEP